MVVTIGTERQGASLTHADAEAQGTNSVAKNVLLFFAAPFIGLAYIIAFPFVGTFFIARHLLRMAVKRT
jgi:hypothetical protein